MERDSLIKNKELVDGQIATLSKHLEASQKDLKERDLLVLSTFKFISARLQKLLNMHHVFSYRFKF